MADRRRDSELGALGDAVTRRHFLGQAGLLASTAAVGCLAAAPLAARPARLLGTPADQAIAISRPRADLLRPWEQLLVGPVLECLTRCDADNRAQPWLAESWEARDDFTTWFFELRADAFWDDGAPVLASDIATNLRELAAGDAPAAALLAGLRPLGAVSVNERRLKVMLERPLPALPEYLSHPALAMRPRRALGVTGPLAMLDGSGPYAVDEWREGEVCRLVRRGAAPGPRHLVFFGQEGDPLAALAEGRVDLIDDFDPTWLAEIEGQAGFAVSVVEGDASLVLRPRLDRAAGADPRLRRALALATDGAPLIETALAGQGRLGGPYGVSERQPDYAALRREAADPEMAALLIKHTALERAGGQLRLGLPDAAPDWLLAAVAGWRRQLADLGVSVVRVAAGAVDVEAELWSHQPLGAMSLNLAFRRQAAESGDAALTAALDALETVADQDGRHDAMRVLGGLLRDRALIVQPFFRHRLQVARSDSLLAVAGHPAGQVLPAAPRRRAQR